MYVLQLTFHFKFVCDTVPGSIPKIMRPKKVNHQLEGNGGRGGAEVAVSMCPWAACIQLLLYLIVFQQYSLLAAFSTWGPRAFTISLHFPCAILFTSCLTELRHTHFSCSNTFAKPEGSDFNTKILLCLYSLPLNLFYFCYHIHYLSSAAKLTRFLPRNNSLLHKQNTVIHT